MMHGMHGMVAFAYMLHLQREADAAKKVEQEKLRDALVARLEKMTAKHETSAASQEQLRSQRPVTTVRARPAP